MFGSSSRTSATSTAPSSSNSETTMSTSIKQEVIENDSPPSAVSDPGEAAAVAAAAAAAAAVVQRHFRLGLNSPPSSVAGRRSALGYSTATGAGSRSARINSTAQPETCVCEVCQVELGRYEALFCHKLLHFNSGNVCYVCDLYFAGGADELRIHVATHHRDIAGLHPKASDTAFVCSVCVQRFSTSKALMRHQVQLHNPAAYSSPISAARKVTCAICTVDFANERELLSHLLGAQHKDMKIKLQSIFICIDCRSIFSNRDAYAFHMMTRAQNETCDVMSAAAAAETALAHSQNGDVMPSLSTSHQQGYQSADTTSTSSPHARNHRQSSVDVRRALTDTGTAGARSARYASERQTTAREAPAGTISQLGARFDNGIGRRWLAGRARNGRLAATDVQLDRKPRNGTSAVLDYGQSGGGLTAPLNLTCQATDRRSTTTTPHAASDDSRRLDINRDRSDWPLSQSAGPTVRQCSGNNGLGVTQRRSVSARTDADERPAKVSRRTCWSVDNITDDIIRSRQLSEPTTVDQPTDDDAAQRRQRSNLSPAAVNNLRQKEATSWEDSGTSTQFVDYCSDVITTKQNMQFSASSVGVHEHVQLAEPIADRLLVDPTWSRLHSSSHDVDLRPAGGIGHSGTSRDCTTATQDPVAADDDDDDALRQLLRLIQQPDGQPVFLCRHCDIVYADRMLYALHMGLHNVNNPWQCNICGTTCSGRQQFALHALHY